jgi:hypothetical protein
MAARIANPNLGLSGGTISSSSEATGYLKEYAFTEPRFKKWRSQTGTSSPWIKIDKGSNQSINMLAAVDARIPTGYTLHLQAHTADSWGAPTLDYTVVVPSPDFTCVYAYWHAATVNLRWFRWYWDNPGAVNDYVELAVAWTSLHIQPDPGLRDGWDLNLIDPSQERRSIGGARTFTRRTRFHEIRGQFEGQNVTNRDILRSHFRTYGRFTPVIFTPDHLNTAYNFYGHIEEMPTRNKMDTFTWDVPFQFTEDVA